MLNILEDPVAAAFSIADGLISVAGFTGYVGFLVVHKENTLQLKTMHIVTRIKLIVHSCYLNIILIFHDLPNLISHITCIIQFLIEMLSNNLQSI